MTLKIIVDMCYFAQQLYDCPCHGYGWITLLQTNVLSKAKDEIRQQIDRKGCGCERGLRIVNKIGEIVE